MNYEHTLEFKTRALQDLEHWIRHDKRKALKILELVDDMRKNPFLGLGKPEPLKWDYKDCWSRRIDTEHRVIYIVEQKNIIILACRYHY